MKKKRILIVEPYYGGSHRHFLEGLKQTIDAAYTLLTLPARKWKMRMQLSAPWFAEQIRTMKREERKFDLILCSTFVDVAVLRALLSNVEGVDKSMKYYTYFHENQFVYPGQEEVVNNHQFTAINFTTALASDGVAFNSQYNFKSFFENCEKYIKKATDMNLPSALSDIEEKSRILFPGLDYSTIDRAQKRNESDTPTIVWNHRWEHDKNPETFFNALYALQERGIPFQLIVLGQSFKSQPPCFKEAEKRLQAEIRHFGFAQSRKEYAALLRQGDIVVSTSHHEFFGISIIEAVRSGCRPLVPNRLSYPELFDRKYLYSDDCLASSLEKLLLKKEKLGETVSQQLTDRFKWSQMKEKYKEWLFGK